MRILTHVLVGLLVVKLLGMTLPIDVLFVIIGSALPDVDFKLGLKHRSVTHSLLFMIVISGFSFLFGLKALPIGFCLHVLLDLMTPMGVMLFYPSYRWFIILGAPLKTGKSDALILLVVLGGILFL